MRGDWKRMLWAGVLLTVALGACGDGDGTDVDPSVAPFVGDWTAQALVITSVADPTVSPDLVELGATFSLNVQPSGRYTGILIYLGQAQTEIGTVSVTGTTLTLNRTFPSEDASPGTFEFLGDDRFVMDGDTEFDFNLDGTPEAALVHFDMVRQ